MMPMTRSVMCITTDVDPFRLDSDMQVAMNTVQS